VVEGVSHLGREVEAATEAEVVTEAQLDAAAHRREVVPVRARREERVRVAIDTQVEPRGVRFAGNERDGGAGAGRGERDGEESRGSET
jgi:hypothetical protein